MKTRILQRGGIVLIFGLLLAACAAPTPQVVEKTVVVPQTVIAPQTVVAPQTVIVRQTAVPATAAPAGSGGLPVNLPRDKVLVLDQIIRYSVVKNYNFYVSGPQPAIQQALIMDTLWFYEQQTGEWINSLAADRPQYNADFTEMTVKLRQGVMWSDGVEFTADDLVFTINTLRNTPGLTFAAEMKLYVKDVTKKDSYTVVVTLTEPNPRFHLYFTARYNAVWMMCKHTWEKAQDIKTFTNFPPVSLGAYVYADSDPNGYWGLWKLRDDWQKTTVGMLTKKPGPENILTVFYGDGMRKAIAMSRHQLDILIDLDIEAFKAVRENNPAARSWFKDFPWAYPNELDVKYFGFNLAMAPYDNKDVRWALALATDIVDLETNYIGGVTRVDPIAVPATASMMKVYQIPMEPWLKQLTIDVGGGETFQPYDSDVVNRIAAWAKKQGYPVPPDANALRDQWGIGWWKYAPDVSAKLLIKNGFKKDASGKWLTPDGKPWKISMIIPVAGTDEVRQALAFVDQMKKFGIDATTESLELTQFYNRFYTGDFVAISSWNQLLVNSNPDLWQGLNPLHSRFFKPVGTPNASLPSNNLRIKSPELDKIIDDLSKLSPEDPKVITLGQDAMKLWVQNMWSIPTISFKKFITEDETYWTGLATAEKPDRQPLFWFLGARFVLPYIEPVKK